MARRIDPLRPKGVGTSRRVLVGIVAAASMYRINAQGYGTSVEPCPNAPDVTGYNTVDALNSDMTAELEKIRAGDPPLEPYMFELCPNTIFNTSATPLIPLLSGSVFSCGSAAAPGTGCDISGGDTQVLIEDPVDVAGYDLQMVSFVGISFLGFSGAAIGGGAGSNTTVDILNARFADFSAMFAVSQQHPGGLKPFKVQVSDSEISAGVGGAAFSNVGGELTLEGVTVTGSAFATVVSTGSASQSGEGSTFLRSVTVTSSDIVDVFSTMGAGDIDAVGVSINNMGSFETVFDVVGEGSTAMVMNLFIGDNDFSAIDPPIRWTAVTIRDNAMASFVDTTVYNSTNIRHVFSASIRSNLDILRAEMTGLTGGRAVDTLDASAIVFGNIDSTIAVNRIVVDDTDLFTGIFFGNAGSYLDVSNSCLLTGNNQAAVYMSEESNFTSISNYADPSYISSVCAEEGLRLVQEQEGSGCFQVNRTDCAFDCMPFFDAGNCTAFESEAPSIAPATMTTGPPASFETEPPYSNVTVSPNSTVAPSMGSNLTETPSSSSAPTLSVPPSFSPSSSREPTISTKPTGGASEAPSITSTLLLNTSAPIPVSVTTAPVLTPPVPTVTRPPLVAPTASVAPATTAPDGSTQSPMQRETMPPFTVTVPVDEPTMTVPGTTAAPDGSTTAAPEIVPVASPVTIPTATVSPVTRAPDGSTLSPVHRETTAPFTISPAMAPAPFIPVTFAPFSPPQRTIATSSPTSEGSKPICDYCSSSKGKGKGKGKGSSSKKSSKKSHDKDCYCPSSKKSKKSSGSSKSKGKGKGKGSVRHHTRVYEAIEGLDKRR